MSLRPRFLLAALLLSGMTACSYDTVTGSGGGGGGGGGGGVGQFIFTAKTNSANWTAGTFAATTTDNGNQVNLVGLQASDTLQISLTLHLSGFRGKGTYNLADPGGPNAVVEYSRLPLTTGNNGLYVTSATATGSVIVTVYNAHTGDAQGTFQFRTIPSGTTGPDVPDTVAITQGHFTGRIAQ